MDLLNEKVAIITGGTRGIGFATAKKFLENGAKVIIFGSKDETVKTAVSKLKDLNKDYCVEGYCPNISSEKAIREVFKTINDKYGKIDILVNNAGISQSQKISEYKEEDYDKIANLNIKSVFICSKEIVPYLKESHGVILNTSSMVSIYGQPAGVMYPASKFAVNGLTKSLARELAPFNIRVNAVAPGIIKTDMVASLKEEVIKPLIATIPLGRIGEPEDIANAFLFLASDMASYVTGEILSVDGAARS